MLLHVEACVLEALVTACFVASLLLHPSTG